ncbi:hypothetical protein [Chryseobacterium sp. MFBS3-17]|nr:hypothetical protein [Chryseobacterium sp. MFBS3-17]MCC2590257.1 hypothetical protein [Chryseobacterium sp. MFBS3-17]
MIKQKTDSVHQNPVEVGLVFRAEDEPHERIRAAARENCKSEITANRSD